MNQKSEQKVIQHKMSVLELAQALGNISEACKRRGASRTQFYEWKRRFQTHGIEGLKDLPPIPKKHPFTTPKDTVNRIKELALSYPSKCCKYIEHLLMREGKKVSLVTIQKHLDEMGLGKRYDHWLALEQLAAESPQKLSGEQVAFIERQNPQFRERHVESSQPGELLNQDTFYVGRNTQRGRKSISARCSRYLLQLCFWLFTF